MAATAKPLHVRGTQTGNRRQLLPNADRPRHQPTTGCRLSSTTTTPTTTPRSQKPYTRSPSLCTALSILVGLSHACAPVVAGAERLTAVWANAPPEYTLNISPCCDHGDGSMLVAPGEQSHLLTGHAAASHDAPLYPSATAPSPSADMEAATADAPSAPADPMAPTVPDLPGAFVPDIPNAPFDPMSTAGLEGQPAMAAAMPSLDAPISLPTDMQSLAADYTMGIPMNGYTPHAPAQQRLSAFARLRFDDGSYYMHTYQIILGRNVQLAHKDMRRLAKVEQLRAKGEPERAQALLHGKKRKRTHGGPRSVISEAGGIVNAPVSMMPMEYQQRRQSIASHSVSSGHGESGQEVEHAPQEMLMQAFPEAPDQLDATVTEDPNDCPLVPIHPQHITHRTGVRGPKGISRQHAKIFYDFETGHFCLAVLGSNGLYHEDQFLPRGACVELSHGDTITIGMVEMAFFLPDIALTEEQRNHQESGSHSRPMSFSFENGQGELESDDGIDDDSVSEDMSSINPRHVYHYPVGSDLESDEDAIGEEDEEMVSRSDSVSLFLEPFSGRCSDGDVLHH